MVRLAPVAVLAQLALTCTLQVCDELDDLALQHEVRRHAAVGVATSRSDPSILLGCGRLCERSPGPPEASVPCLWGGTQNRSYVRGPLKECDALYHSSAFTLPYLYDATTLPVSENTVLVDMKLCTKPHGFM